MYLKNTERRTKKGDGDDASLKSSDARKEGKQQVNTTRLLRYNVVYDKTRTARCLSRKRMLDFAGTVCVSSRSLKANGCLVLVFV